MLQYIFILLELLVFPNKTETSWYKHLLVMLQCLLYACEKCNTKCTKENSNLPCWSKVSHVACNYYKKNSPFRQDWYYRLVSMQISHSGPIINIMSQVGCFKNCQSPQCFDFHGGCKIVERSLQLFETYLSLHKLCYG